MLLRFRASTYLWLLLDSMSFFNLYSRLFFGLSFTFLLLLLHSMLFLNHYPVLFLSIYSTYLLIPIASFYVVLQSLLFAVLQSLFYLLMSGTSFCVFLQQPVPVNSLLKGPIRFNTFLFVHPMFVLLRK